MADVWLNEGFATYVEWLWTEDHGGTSRSTGACARPTTRTAADSGFWTPPVSDPGPDDMWDSPVYQRGAMTLAALRHRIGDADFTTLLRQWVATAAVAGTAPATEFRALAEQVSGQDLDAFFDALARRRAASRRHRGRTASADAGRMAA